MANGQLLGFIDSGQDLNGQLRNNGDEIIGEVSASGQVLGALIGQSGRPGVGIASIVKTGTSGLIDTYTITYTNNTTSTFEVTNGQQGNPGATGNGISNIAKTSSAGLVDTYTITYTNGDTDTFTVTNGAGGAWGSITGTLADQTDLKSALDDKISKSLTSGLVKNDGTIDTTTYSTFSGNYSDLSGKPTIPTVNDKKITIQKNGTDIDYFTTNASANKTINITVPTDTNDLTNSAGFIDNTVNNLINYFKKADSTLPVYFVNASEHNTSGTAFNFAEKPVGLYLFYPASNTNYTIYIKPRSSGVASSYSNNVFFIVHIENVIPETYVNDVDNYMLILQDSGIFRKYKITAKSLGFDETLTTKQFITSDNDNTISGQLTFSTIPKTSITPTNDDHFTRKKYVDDLLSAFKDAAYPIGKTELFYDNLDHSDYLGFTWVLDFEGQFPVGIDTNDTDFDTIGKTGGDKELQEHRHAVEYSTDDGTTWADGAIGKEGAYDAAYYIATAGTKIGAFSQYQARIKNAGSGHGGNLPPFKVIAIWRRTA